MANDTRSRFLFKAREAETQAARAKNPKVKESWQKIAASYRDLAEHARNGDTQP